MDLPGGGRGIRSIKGLQIVNGGQTTASLHHAARRDRAELENVYVPAKLTVIREDRLTEIVPLISRYANSQNRISEADFSANDPFHVIVEGLSRTVWAPATGGTQRQTRWFYERARGQYADALGREGTPARQRRFKQEHPSSQRFTKTDLAKFENTWDQLPHFVSRGAQKNFAEFAIRLSGRGKVVPDAAYFRDLVAKAILFRRTERIVSQQNYGGYRANIVTYSLAYIAHATAHRIDLDRIWREQAITAGLEAAIIEASVGVQRILTNPPGGANVTEWAKKPACWEIVRALGLDVTNPLEQELISLDRAWIARPVSGLEAPDADERQLIAQVGAISHQTWMQLSHWAKETGNLETWQRGIAFSVGRRLQQGRDPSRKQATQAVRILNEAQRLGFRGDAPSAAEEPRNPIDDATARS
jgi:hypothetical protein